MRWTPEQAQEHMQKAQGWNGKHITDDSKIVYDEGPESALQRKIEAWAKDKGFPCLSFRQSKKAQGFLLAGWPDVTLCLAKGRVVFLELKTGKGRLSEEQRQMARHMLFHGHRWHEVRSYKRFLEIVA